MFECRFVRKMLLGGGGGGGGGGGAGLEICLSSAHSFLQRPNAA
jgi:hypothetical protein